jgi:hypothetical protein
MHLVAEVVRASDDISETLRRRQLVAIRRFLTEISSRRDGSPSGSRLTEIPEAPEASSA